MRFCTNCGQRLEDDAVRCPSCGAPVGAVTKNNTGAQGNPYDVQRNPNNSQGGPNSWQYSQAGARYEADRQYLEPVSVGDWLLTTFLLVIPFLGLILMIVWSLSSTINPSKKSYCRAMLVWRIIGVILVGVFYFLFGYAYVRNITHFSYSASMLPGWFIFC